MPKDDQYPWPGPERPVWHDALAITVLIVVTLALGIPFGMALNAMRAGAGLG